MRETLINLIREAQVAGASLKSACAEAEVSLRTYRRWFSGGKVHADQRPDAVRPEPANKLIPTERDAIREICNRPEFANIPPLRIPTHGDRSITFMPIT